MDLHTRQITLRHTKTGKIQVIPLCSLMGFILRDYMSLRGGESTDYLFCEMLLECALRQSIAKYNQRRGVQKTSIRLFRHTFVRKYLVDCGGNAFTLRKLRGQSTLKMTKHNCTVRSLTRISLGTSIPFRRWRKSASRKIESRSKMTTKKSKKQASYSF